jgi:hypothetical protein
MHSPGHRVNKNRASHPQERGELAKQPEKAASAAFFVLPIGLSIRRLIVIRGR